MLKTKSPLFVVFSVATLLSLLLFAGCSKNEEQANAPDDATPRMGGPDGSRGPGGPMGGPGGGRRSEPVATNATAPEIFQKKCQGCHGDKGQGKRGPALDKVANRPNEELHQIIHNGHKKMPSFAKQMSDAQIDSLVVYIKTLVTDKSGK